ncbi:MAG: uncharacterized protein KVP18_002945 [Porospora cf. gigantea A]|uniref:uncharacterized protein n=1 Tax=Porospora cf. gigantea A TaxID=2853593 RepID=UPI003559EAF4|nr:MAG: hypothetical protein KVP18_002945 [Porospora cf. gigantea A]
MQEVEKTGNDSCSVRWWRVGSKSKDTRLPLSQGSALSLTLTEATLSISDSRSFELSMDITFYFVAASCQHDTFVFRGCFVRRGLRIDTSSILQRGVTIPKGCVHVKFDLELTLFEHPTSHSGSLERRRVRRSISSNTAHLFGAMHLPVASTERQHRCTLMHKTQYVTCDLNFEVGFPKATQIPTPRIPSLGAVCKQLSGRAKRHSSFKYKHQYSNEDTTTTAGVSSHERFAQSSIERSMDRSWRGADHSSVDGPAAILSQVVSVNSDGWDESESSSSYVAHYAKVDRFKPSGFESGNLRNEPLETKRSGPSFDDLTKKLTTKKIRHGHGLERMKRTDTRWWGTAKTKQITKKMTVHEPSEQPQRFDERRMGKFAAMTSDI